MKTFLNLVSKPFWKHITSFEFTKLDNFGYVFPLFLIKNA